MTEVLRSNLPQLLVDQDVEDDKEDQGDDSVDDQVHVDDIHLDEGHHRTYFSFRLSSESTNNITTAMVYSYFKVKTIAVL